MGDYPTFDQGEDPILGQKMKGERGMAPANWCHAPSAHSWGCVLNSWMSSRSDEYAAQITPALAQMPATPVDIMGSAPPCRLCVIGSINAPTARPKL
jgi:hypothetical protein